MACARTSRDRIVFYCDNADFGFINLDDGRPAGCGPGRACLLRSLAQISHAVL